METTVNNNLFVSSSVGIGTDKITGYQLSVDGKIRCMGIKVYDSQLWAVFVFEPDYKLNSLEQVEKYIAEYGHLQNIPSSEDVKENGIELAEMNAKLLLKIEELTLYAIEQNKRLEQVEMELIRLKGINE